MTTVPRPARPLIIATNHPEAREAAEACLRDGGAAVDAAIAAFFALAGVTPWGLLAPVSFVVAGSGAGVRFVDGRARQPGKGIERPVRFADPASVPTFARASVPGSLGAIATAAAMFGTQTLAALAAYGSKPAKKLGATERAALLVRVGAAKAWALQDRSFGAELAERVPRFEGALLGPDDLELGSVEVCPREPSLSIAGLQAVVAPWDEQAPEHPRVIVLVAHRGMSAGLVVEHVPRSIPMFEGQIELPALAAPILKGVPRLKAGAPLPMRAPLAVLVQKERPVALVAATSGELDEAEVSSMLTPPEGGWGAEELVLRASRSLGVRLG